MFKEYITNPIDPIPYEYTKTLNRLSLEPDYSLTSLGLAMLKPRVENYHGIAGQYLFVNKKKDAYETLKNFYDNNTNSISFYYFVYSETDDSELDEYKDLKRKRSIETLIKEKAETDCTVFYSETSNFAAIIIRTRDIKLYHLLASFLPLYYPKIFKDKPATNEEHELIKSLSKKDKNAFIKNLQKLVYPYAIEFRTLQLSSLLKNMHEQKINAAFEEVKNRRRYVEQKRQEYAQMIEALKDCIVKYEGLKATEQYDETENELVQYLAQNKNVRNVTVEGNKIKFTVITELINFNEEAWENFDRKGGIYDGHYGGQNLPEVFMSKDNRKLLLNSIFSEDAEFTVKLCGNYCIDLYNCSVRTYSNYDYTEANPEFKSCIVNPHLKIFECLGGYRERIPDALRQREYISAIEMCVMSAGSIDLDETEQTFRPFLGWLLTTDEKVLKRKDGTEMSPQEALVWLIDNKKE